MITKFKTIVICFLLGFTAVGQEVKDKVLLKIDGEPIYQSEFIRLFGKNKNLELVDEKQSLKEDVKLFVDYKLKLIEAKDLKLDTIKAYKKEVSKYRNQLVLPYLSDNSVTDGLLKEAYERSLKEIRASHILIQVQKNTIDTLKAYTKITKLRNQIIAGADFSEIAKTNSEDPSAKKNKGDLGYFSVFRMVSSFENVAYKTPKGKVSSIFRSEFGYHIIKVVDVRESLGEVEAAHIMIRDTTSSGKKTIDKVYYEIIKEGNFEELAKKHSDDRRTALNGGKLPKFTMGALPPPFGEVSFALSDKNMYSKPFRTAYGWHIVKFIKRYPVGSFKDCEKDLLRKLKKDSRSKNLGNPVVDRLRKEYNIKVNEIAKNDFNDSKKIALIDSLNSWLLVIEKDTLKQKDFMNYNMNRRDKKVMDNFKPFVDEEILAYYKKHLEESNVEFKNLFQEYRNGLLLFDLMKLKIWDAAQNDTLGLQKYFNKNYKKYSTKASVNAIVISTKRKEEVASIELLVKGTKSTDSIKRVLELKEDVLVKSGDFEKSATVFPKGVIFEKGTTKTYKEKGYFFIVRIIKEKAPIQLGYADVRGTVISDYQNYIQDEWMQELREKHKVKVYKSRLKKIKKEINLYSE